MKKSRVPVKEYSRFYWFRTFILISQNPLFHEPAWLVEQEEEKRAP